MFPFLIAVFVLGAGVATPGFVRAADRRKAAAAEAARQALARAEQDRQAAADAAEARQAEADATEQRELGVIAADPARHLWRMMLAAWRQRIQGRKQALSDAQRAARWVREDVAAAKLDLASHEGAHPWVRNPRTRQLVDFGAKAAFVVLPLVYILDRMITTAVYGGVYGELLAPFALVLVGAGCLVGTWALGLGEHPVNVLRSTARMLALAGAAVLVLGTTWVLMLWAPARPDHLYGPQIQAATTAWQKSQQAGKSNDEVAAVLQTVNDLTAQEKRWEKVDQGLVGLQVLLEGGVAEAVMMSQATRRRRGLSDALSQGPAAIRYADAQVEVAAADLREDATQVVARMSDVLTRIGTPLQEQRQIILTALQSSNDLDVYHGVTAAADSLAGTKVLPASDPSDVTVSIDDTLTDSADSTSEAAAGRATPAAPAPTTPPAGTVPKIEEIPMPEPAIDLDALDEAL